MCSLSGKHPIVFSHFIYLFIIIDTLNQPVFALHRHKYSQNVHLVFKCVAFTSAILKFIWLFIQMEKHFSKGNWICKVAMQSASQMVKQFSNANSTCKWQCNPQFSLYYLDFFFNESLLHCISYWQGFFDSLFKWNSMCKVANAIRNSNRKAVVKWQFNMQMTMQSAIQWVLFWLIFLMNAYCISNWMVMHFSNHTYSLHLWWAYGWNSTSPLVQKLGPTFSWFHVLLFKSSTVCVCINSLKQ